MTLDATQIVPGLWQGGLPADWGELRDRFDAVVFCAQEFQPDDALLSYLSGVAVIRAPNDDRGKPPTSAQLETAVKASGAVAEHVRAGRRVLVTCFEGRNRSGLVVALALHRLTGRSGAVCAAAVRSKRATALTNPHFNLALATLTDKRRKTR